MEFYQKTALECSKLITNRYSTSFSLGIKALDAKFHPAIYAIYGFVRFADEIVDSFHDFDKESLLNRFKGETFRAITEGISLNPVLEAFQWAVNVYHIDLPLIEAFLHSMEMDLELQRCDQKDYERYIYGSAEVVGLMCLRVFCEGDHDLYRRLEPAGKKLGSAFQKVNFLRDLQADYHERGRVYFPGATYEKFDLETKRAIELDIRSDFEEALVGIRMLPVGAKSGVYLAYTYYLSLFKRICLAGPDRVMTERIRIPDLQKFWLWALSYARLQTNQL
jgi:15-cis-phytoene synthase